VKFIKTLFTLTAVTNLLKDHMNFHKKTFLVIILFGLFSCQKSDESIQATDDNQDVGYTQYGTPFVNTPLNSDIILYEVNLRAFSASGNLQGVIQKLDHIESLGTNVIWLMPIHPVGQINSVNSPYSVKDYKTIGTEYGNLEDLRQLTEEAHSRGIAVIMDWVANHTSWDNEWIRNTSWYTQDNNGNIISPAGTNWQDVADLDFTNNDMRVAMIDAMKYWIYEANIDGFRCDFADGVPFNFWSEAITSINTISNKDYIFFAEGNRADHFNAGFDLNFGWDSYAAIKEVFNGQLPSRVFTANTNEYNNSLINKHWVRFTTNHDESAWDATPINLFNGQQGALAASVVTVLTGGVPLIYGGQEVGVSQNIPFFSNSTFNWNANPDLLNSYQDLFQFYSQSSVAKRGQNIVYSNNDIVCFKKVLGNEEVVIIVNIRNAIKSFNLPNELENTNWVDVLSQNTVSFSSQLTLEPYKFYILKQ
jgi:glycosidase